METVTSHAAGVSVGPVPPRTVKAARRENKNAYRKRPGHSSRYNNTALPLNPSSPEQSCHENHEDQQLHGQSPGRDHLGHFELSRPSTSFSNTSPVVDQNCPDETWLLLSSPAFPLQVDQSQSAAQQTENCDGGHGQPPSSGVHHFQETSWAITAPQTSNLSSEMDGMADMQIISLGDFDVNSMSFSAANTGTSSISETYIYPLTSGHFDPSGNPIGDLELPSKRLIF